MALLQAAAVFLWLALPVAQVSVLNTFAKKELPDSACVAATFKHVR